MKVCAKRALHATELEISTTTYVIQVHNGPKGARQFLGVKYPGMYRGIKFRCIEIFPFSLVKRQVKAENERGEFKKN